MAKMITNFVDTGECEVNVKEVVKRWKPNWFISQWQEKYTLVNKTVKVVISKQQAKEIIVELDLEPIQSVFRSGKTWKVTN
jgi:hypothetical protein